MAHSISSFRAKTMRSKFNLSSLTNGGANSEKVYISVIVQRHRARTRGKLLIRSVDQHKNEETKTHRRPRARHLHLEGQEDSCSDPSKRHSVGSKMYYFKLNYAF